MSLITDIVAIIVRYADEREYPNMRLVNWDWNIAVGQNLIKGSASELIRKGHYMSAMHMLQLPRADRIGFPIHPNKALIAACEIPHTGIIKYIVGQPTWRTTLRSDKCMRLLLTHAKLELIILIKSLGYNHPELTLEYAAQCNSTVLAELITCDQSPHSLDRALDLAMSHNNESLAKIIYSHRSFRPRTNTEIIKLIDISIDTALACINDASPNIIRAVYAKLVSVSHPKYTTIISCLKAIIDDYDDVEQKRVLMGEMLDHMLMRVKSIIARGLSNKYPGANIKWFLTHISNINWTLPWGYVYSIHNDEIWVTRVYNL